MIKVCTIITLIIRRQEKQMRVLHIIKVKAVAGAEHHLLALLRGLRGAGIDTQIIVLTEPQRLMDDYLAQLTAAGIPTERMIIQRHFAPRLIMRLRRRLRELYPDIVHTHLLHADLHGIPAARSSGVSSTP
jgi:hypothetical protein